jgi:adenylate cyclase
VAIRTLVSPHAVTPARTHAHRSLAGSEQQVAVLFADLRKFTSLAERRLPYDVVFFLNRYFEAAGRAIERAGGVTNQFTGDGVMALFGVDGDAARGCTRVWPSSVRWAIATRCISRRSGTRSTWRAGCRI